MPGSARLSARRGPTARRCWSFPGGGYEFLSVQNEGLDPAERFNAERTTVFVLTYRLPGRGLERTGRWSPLQDAQRAMRLIRARAAEFRIDPARLGVLGFSAGGHLAADLAVSHADRDLRAGRRRRPAVRAAGIRRPRSIR